MSKEFIIIDLDFCPEVAAHLGKSHMKILIDDWESIYHKDVQQVFNRLREKYCGA